MKNSENCYLTGTWFETLASTDTTEFITTMHGKFIPRILSFHSAQSLLRIFDVEKINELPVKFFCLLNFVALWQKKKQQQKNKQVAKRYGNIQSFYIYIWIASTKFKLFALVSALWLRSSTISHMTSYL